MMVGCFPNCRPFGHVAVLKRSGCKTVDLKNELPTVCVATAPVPIGVPMRTSLEGREFQTACRQHKLLALA